jgi:hypothetical protein
MVMKMLFVHASEGTQVIAQAGSGAFHRVVMDFTHPIAVIVPRPFAPTWRVTNLLEYASLLWQVIIGLPFIRVHGTACRGMGFYKRLKRPTVAMMTHLQTNLTTFSAHHTGYRRMTILPGTMSFDLVSPPPGWIIGIPMFATLFACIMIHFIGFGDGVEQG